MLAEGAVHSHWGEEACSEVAVGSIDLLVMQPRPNLLGQEVPVAELVPMPGAQAGQEACCPTLRVWLEADRQEALAGEAD